MSQSTRTPLRDADSAPFWDAVEHGRLIAQYCANCGSYVFYPRSLCPHCHACDLEWRDLQGTGSIYSYTTSRLAPGPDFEGEVPYVVALIELDEGIRMMSNVVDVEPEGVRCGDRVEVVFRDVEGQILPQFRHMDA